MRPFITVSITCALVSFGPLQASAQPASTPFRLAEATVATIQSAFTSGQLMCTRLTRLYLDRIEAYDARGPALRAILMVNPKAMETAAEMDRRYAANPSGAGPLHCVPVIFKDNFNTSDMPTTAGNIGMKTSLPPTDAFTVKKIREAGALILAKANLSEFARGGMSKSSLGGQTLNPYDLTRTPGGSSGGTGAAIAANFAVLGTGSDTGRSIRSPASANSLVGIRPTRGLVKEALMRFFFGTLALATGLSAQTANAPAELVRTVAGRLELERFKAHIKGLTQFGDRIQGTQRNRDAVDWIEKQLRSFGYSNIERHRFMSGSGPLENIYATKIGTTIPGEMYIVSAHMDGRGGGEAADDDASGCAVVLELARVLGLPDVQTNRSVRFIFWNNEEFGMDGSGTYALERAPLQGTAAEPKWLGVIQHDMMMFDHGMPPGPKQSVNADINIEYQTNSRMAADSAKLAAALQAANRSHVQDYPATIGTNMAGTDSIRFQDLVASVSVRENERVTGIVRGSNPNHHEPTDKYENYGEEDFRFGFNSVQTTLGALGQLAGVTLMRSR